MNNSNAFDNEIEMFEKELEEMLNEMDSSSKTPKSLNSTVKERKMNMSKPKKAESSIRLVSLGKSARPRSYPKAHELYDVIKRGNVIFLKSKQKRIQKKSEEVAKKKYEREEVKKELARREAEKKKTKSDTTKVEKAKKETAERERIQKEEAQREKAKIESQKKEAEERKRAQREETKKKEDAEKASRQETKEKKKMMEQISKRSERIAREEERNAIKEQRAEEKRKKKITKKISRSLKQRAREEEKIARKEQRITQKEERIAKAKAKKFDKPKRFTEPKKRNLLSRIILQQRLAGESFDELESDYDRGYITREDIETSKNATKRRDKKLYKEVQKYEDALDDVTVRRGWLAFKVGLAAAMLAGSLALASYSVNEMKDLFNEVSTTVKAVSIYDVDEEEREYIYSASEYLKQKIIKNDGYHFDNLTESEFADGYYRIEKYESKLYENAIKSASIKLDGDKELLERIVEKSFGDDYASLTDSQKRDYTQLAYELLPIVLSEKYENNNGSYLRNPIVMDELEAKNNAKEKGYKVKLKVNNGEEETVKRLGYILHTLNEMQDIQYKTVDQIENGQELFFQNIMIESIGEENYNELSDSDKRDYNQIIYEWLSDDAKQYIQDPIEVEKANDEMEIGG